MPVFLAYPDAPEKRRADSIVAVVVEAADAASAPAAAHALVRTSNRRDFEEWSLMRIADAPAADFRPFVVEGRAVVGRGALPSLGAGGDRVVTDD